MIPNKPAFVILTVLAAPWLSSAAVEGPEVTAACPLLAVRDPLDAEPDEEGDELSPETEAVYSSWLEKVMQSLDAGILGV